MAETIAKDKLLTREQKQACKRVAEATDTNVVYVGLLAELYKTEPGEGKYEFGIPDSTSIRSLAETEFGWSTYKRGDASTHDGKNDLDCVTNGLIAEGLLVKRTARGGRPFVQWDDGKRSARPALSARFKVLSGQHNAVAQTNASEPDDSDDDNEPDDAISLKEVRAIAKQIVKGAGLKLKTKGWIAGFKQEDYEDMNRAEVVKALCETLCTTHPKAQHTAILTAGFEAM